MERAPRGGYPYDRKCCEWGDQGGLMIALQKYGEAGLRHVRYDGFRDYSSHFPFYGEGDLVVHMPGSEFLPPPPLLPRPLPPLPPAALITVG
jgi:hypothetical protein